MGDTLLEAGLSDLAQARGKRKWPGLDWCEGPDQPELARPLREDEMKWPERWKAQLRIRIRREGMLAAMRAEMPPERFSKMRAELLLEMLAEENPEACAKLRSEVLLEVLAEKCPETFAELRTGLRPEVEKVLREELRPRIEALLSAESRPDIKN